jgi:hypothetical protein
MKSKHHSSRRYSSSSAMHVLCPFRQGLAQALVLDAAGKINSGDLGGRERLIR